MLDMVIDIVVFGFLALSLAFYCLLWYVLWWGIKNGM